MSAPLQVAWASRDGFESRFLCARLAALDEVQIASLLIEGGGPARRAKAARTLRRAGVRGSVRVMRDLMGVHRYHQQVTQKLPARVAALGHPAPPSFPLHANRVDVADANDEAGIAWAAACRADVLVVHGTALLGRSFLDAAPSLILNVHGGIVPTYRNVHGDAWALLRNDRGNVGTSLLYLDAGVDTGDVALQGRVALDPQDDIFDAKAKNLLVAASLLEEAMQHLMTGTLPREPQPTEGRGFFPTPGHAELRRLLSLSDQS